ncbi:hypothetical protein GCM10016234_13330 [Tianweitania populi]|uniref:DUF4435 domain-containing protein n=2 Tax=Tianweitania populi TaxID=1607949 RepID=A0A8J3GK34_9HYPH|nr:hypothetical protein GCM10016234_13330 [Tianweitania populi]
MLPCGADRRETSQIRPLAVTADLDVVLADLVGDLAAYRPGGKGLIFEGGGDSDFDKAFVGQLFATELRGINLISGTNKERVKLLHQVLSRAYEKGDLPTKYYAVTDRDTLDGNEDSPAVNRFQWDVYHIENFLLVENIVCDVANSLGLSNRYTPDTITNALSLAARKVVSEVLIHRMRTHANKLLINSINLGFSPNTLTIGKELGSAVSRSVERINGILTTALSESKLVDEEQRIREDIEQSFANGTWKNTLPGREILKRFCDDENLGIGYEVFRNLLVSKMVDLGHKPEGMRRIIETVRDD